MLRELRSFREQIAYQDCPQGRKLATDLPEVTDREINIAAETSYRRGFEQGVAMALEVMQSGRFTVEDLAAWRWRLYRWRRKKHGGKFRFPEMLGR